MCEPFFNSEGFEGVCGNFGVGVVLRAGFFGFPVVKNSGGGGWSRVGFHFSFTVRRRFAALSDAFVRVFAGAGCVGSDFGAAPAFAFL